MELAAYLRVFKKWLWLIVLLAFITGGASFVFQSSRNDKYVAQTTIAVGSYIQQANRILLMSAHRLIWH